MSADPRQPSRFARTLRVIALVVACIVALGCVAWAFGALHYDFPVLRGAVAWAFAVVVSTVFIRGAWRKIGSIFLALALVLAWWFTLEPSNERNWQPDVAQLAWAEHRGR
jgi:hypothetical protein